MDVQTLMSDQYIFPTYITLTCTQKRFDIKTTLKNKGKKKWEDWKVEGTGKDFD